MPKLKIASAVLTQPLLGSNSLFPYVFYVNLQPYLVPLSLPLFYLNSFLGACTKTSPQSEQPITTKIDELPAQESFDNIFEKHGGADCLLCS
tara:strand:+ start:602 stop:877 length:276 start_codon:yes stop_codon:yes gene_type:complete